VTSYVLLAAAWIPFWFLWIRRNITKTRVHITSRPYENCRILFPRWLSIYRRSYGDQRFSSKGCSL